MLLTSLTIYALHQLHMGTESMKNMLEYKTSLMSHSYITYDYIKHCSRSMIVHHIKQVNIPRKLIQRESTKSKATTNTIKHKLRGARGIVVWISEVESIGVVESINNMNYAFIKFELT
ncbi:hypothetical protein QQ045_029394 [Rhodiola kirilowii]